MTPQAKPEVLLRAEPTEQVELPLAADGIARWIWEGRFGPMLIEARDGKVYVNGELVQRLDEKLNNESNVP